MNSKNIFDHMRKNGLTQKQVDSFYELIKQGAKIETVAEFVGYSEQDPEPKKSGFKLGDKSIEKLAGVNPDLVRVVSRAIEISAVDFMVLEGIRTKEQAYINYGKGRSAAELDAKGVPVKYADPKSSKVTWLSYPLGSKHMTGNAVDLAPYPIDWNDLARFDQVALAMFKAAAELGVRIKWGADWNGNGRNREKGESDSPHFELA